ncbi:hypothetical protein GIB67_039630, partial [Kingdonia uniflora]
MAEERDRRDNQARYSKDHHEGKRKDVPVKRDDANTCPKELLFQKLRVNINSRLSPSHNPYSFVKREESISRERNSSNFNRSLPFYRGLPVKSDALLSEVKVVTGDDDCCSSSTEVIGTVTADKLVVPSGRDMGLHAGIETGQFFMYPENIDVAKKFLKYKRSLGGKWGHYVMNEGLWFRTLVRPDGKIDHYQVPSLDKWKGNMGIGDDIDISYYKGTSAEPNPKGAADTSILLDVVCREGTELNKVLGALGIHRENSLNFIVEKVQRAHQNQAMATSGSTYDDIMEISDCAAGTLSPLVWRPREALELAKRDPIRLDTQIRSSISQLSVAWKSAAEVLKVNTADYAEYEAEKTSLVEQLKEQTVLCEQLQKEKVLQRKQFVKEKALQKDQIEKEAATTKKEVEDEAKKVVDIVGKLAVLSTSNKELSAKLRQCSLAVENTTLLKSKLEYEMLELQSQLNVVTVELPCKDTDILTANNEAELWKESLKKKKLETMATNQQVLDLLSTIEKQKNDLLHHQPVVTNNIDLIKKQDTEIRHMRECLKKLNWDLCECMRGNEVYEELHVKYKESQRLVDAADDEIQYSKKVDKKLQRLKQEIERSVQITKQYRDSLLQEKNSLTDRCKDLEDELNKVKTERGEAMMITADDVKLRTMAMLHADVEKFRTDRDSILAASTEYCMEYDLQLARLSYIDNLMVKVMELLNTFSSVVDAAIPFPALLSSGPGESSNVVHRSVR